MTPSEQTEYTQNQIQLKQQQTYKEAQKKQQPNPNNNKNNTQDNAQQTIDKATNKKQLKRTQQQLDIETTNTPTKRIKLIPNQEQQKNN